MSGKKVAVIGAGLAGLTTAYRLQQHGVHVDVFEATSRVGGRVFTVLMGNYLGQVTEVELGAQNSTDGGEASHLLKLVQELGLSIRPKVINVDQIVYVGNQHDYFHNLVEGHHKGLQDLRSLATQVDNMGDLIRLFCDGNALLQEALLSRMTAYEGVDVNRQSIYHNLETLEYTLSGGVAKSHEVYQHEHNQVVTGTVEGGNARLAMGMAATIGERLHYNKVLQQVIVQENGATVGFEDQSVYHYDYVVLAIPAATFQNIDLSRAKIDPATLQKICSIEHGKNYKIALPLNVSKRGNISSMIKNNAMSFYNYDSSVQLLYINDALNDIKGFLSTLSEVYGSDLASYPVDNIIEAADENYKVYRQGVTCNWQYNRFFQGSYTGYSVAIAEELDVVTHHNGTAYKALFAPIDDTLFFAGEHTTILECIGTMEAAAESGERIASAIAELKA